LFIEDTNLVPPENHYYQSQNKETGRRGSQETQKNGWFTRQTWEEIDHSLQSCTNQLPLASEAVAIWNPSY